MQDHWMKEYSQATTFHHVLRMHPQRQIMKESRQALTLHHVLPRHIHRQYMTSDRQATPHRTLLTIMQS